MRLFKPVSSDSSMLTYIWIPIFNSALLRTELKPNQLSIRYFMFVVFNGKGCGLLYRMCDCVCVCNDVLHCCCNAYRMCWFEGDCCCNVYRICRFEEGCGTHKQKYFFPFKTRLNSYLMGFQILKILKLELGSSLWVSKMWKLEASAISALIWRIILHAGCYAMPCMSGSVCTEGPF